MSELNFAAQFDQHQEGVDIGLEPVENTFTDMVRATLNAILNQDKDVEMQCRSALKADYKSVMVRSPVSCSKPLRP